MDFDPDYEVLRRAAAGVIPAYDGMRLSGGPHTPDSIFNSHFMRSSLRGANGSRESAPLTGSAMKQSNRSSAIALALLHELSCEPNGREIAVPMDRSAKSNPGCRA